MDSGIHDKKPYLANAADGRLTITVNKDFDLGNLKQDWARSILTDFPGPFKIVRVDLALVVRVSSMFYAGLMQMHFAFTGMGSKPLVLVKPDPRVMVNLKVLHLDQYFTIEA